jgi:hypothetical protein
MEVFTGIGLVVVMEHTVTTLIAVGKSITPRSKAECM